MVDILESFGRAEVETEALKGTKAQRFGLIPPRLRYSNRPDLHAFILLERLVPGMSNLVSASSEHEIFLDVDVGALAERATYEDILTLVRCGVHYDKLTESLYMWS